MMETNNTVTAEATQQVQKMGEQHIDEFLDAVQSTRYETIPTGITDIDAAIGGGLLRQQLVLLGAAPGVGKTALAQWIFEGMAQRGIKCLYLNLEMSREQMIARSLARISARNGKKIKTTDILQGYKWNLEQREAVISAADEYKQKIAPYMVYNPDNTTANIDSIIERMEIMACNYEKMNEQAPIVVIDYLQLVSGKEREDTTETIKRSVAALKSYAIRHNTVVFVIIAHNRNSNSNGTVTMEAGRDTSALEYSADLQLGLAYTACIDDRKKKPEELEQDEKREVTLVITKSRFGMSGIKVNLHFDGETMTYTQTLDVPPWEYEKTKRKGKYDSRLGCS